MKNYYKRLKIFFIITDIYIIILFGIVIISTLLSHNYEDLLTIIPLFSFSAVFIASIEIFLIRYYGNIVVSVEFSGDDVILITNTKRHTLPAKHFSMVEEVPSLGRIFIIYDDGKTKKKFTFKMKCLVFKPYHHLNIQEMREHMPYTKFSSYV